MDAIDALVRSLPGNSAQIRRRVLARSGLPDHLRGLSRRLEMLAKVEAEQPCDAGRVDEYRELADELLAEATAMLRRR